MDFLTENKEWIFSGIGIFALGLIMAIFKSNNSSRRDNSVISVDRNIVVFIVFALILLLTAFIYHEKKASRLKAAKSECITLLNFRAQNFIAKAENEIDHIENVLNSTRQDTTTTTLSQFQDLYKELEYLKKIRQLFDTLQSEHIKYITNDNFIAAHEVNHQIQHLLLLKNEKLIQLTDPNSGYAKGFSALIVNEYPGNYPKIDSLQNEFVLEIWTNDFIDSKVEVITVDTLRQKIKERINSETVINHKKK